MPCPAGVDIPGCFSLYNAHFLFPHDRSARFHYMGRHGGLLANVSYAGLCRQCGKCVKNCPQHIPVPEQAEGSVQRAGWKNALYCAGDEGWIMVYEQDREDQTIIFLRQKVPVMFFDPEMRR